MDSAVNHNLLDVKALFCSVSDWNETYCLHWNKDHLSPILYEHDYETPKDVKTYVAPFASSKRMCSRRFSISIHMSLSCSAPVLTSTVHQAHCLCLELLWCDGTESLRSHLRILLLPCIANITCDAYTVTARTPTSENTNKLTLIESHWSAKTIAEYERERNTQWMYSKHDSSSRTT